MVDLILTLVLAVIAGSIIAYLVHEKKKGVTCIGCPYARDCAKRHNSQACAKAKQGGCSCGTTHTATTTAVRPAVKPAK